MEILKSLNLKISSNRLSPYLLIGGHAVNILGFNRQTGDIDLLVQSSKKSQWMEVMDHYKFECTQEHQVFCRFRSKNYLSWPVDLMLVNDDTFEQMHKESIKTTLNNTQIRIPCPKHLITLKVHALKEFREDRRSKDILDIIEVAKRNMFDVKSEEFRNICKKYATIELYEEINKIKKK